MKRLFLTLLLFCTLNAFAALERKDAVKDQTSTTGTITFVITGVAPAGARSITTAHTSGSTVRYRAVNSDGSQWEDGEGVVTNTSGTWSLTRATVFTSSNSGSLVNFTTSPLSLLTVPTAKDFDVPDWSTGSSIASATTINLDAATGGVVHVTGTTTIGTVTLARGPRLVIFDGTLTLTHNATTNNLPGGANIVVNAGDRMMYVSDGTTVYGFLYGDASDVATTNTGTQTLTNKTLTTPVINGTPTGTGVNTANSSNTLVLRGASGEIAGGGATFVSAVLTGNSFNYTGSNAGFEIGAQGSSNTPYIDFHSGASVTDYDARILASGGTGVDGNGSLSITAASVGLSGPLSTVGSVTTSATSGSPNLISFSQQAAGFGPGTVSLRRWGASAAKTPDSSAVGQILFDGLNGAGTPAYTQFAAIDTDIGANGANGAPATLSFWTADGSTGLVRRMGLDNAGLLSVTGGTNGNIASIGSSGYGSFTATGSGTNNAYMFFTNATSGERARIAVDNGSSIFFNTGSSPAPQFALGNVASAVNYFAVTGDTTGNGPHLSASGSDTNIQINYASKGTGVHAFYNGAVIPGADNTQTLGVAGNRWSTVYAGTGTINTSDAREKTPVERLTKNELAAAIALSHEVGGFKWLSEGDAAKRQIGMTAQRVIAVMTANGLDAERYGFIVHDTWEAKGDMPAGDRYGIRYDQLALFIEAGLTARLDRLEAANDARYAKRHAK